MFRDEANVCSPGEFDRRISRIRIGNDRRALIKISSNELNLNECLSRLSRTKCVWPIFHSSGCVAGVYMNLEDFLMLRLEVKGSSDRPFQGRRSGTKRYWRIAVRACLVVSRVPVGINLRLPLLSLGDVYPLTVYYPISFFVVTYRIRNTLSKLAGRIWLRTGYATLCRNLLEGYGYVQDTQHFVETC